LRRRFERHYDDANRNIIVNEKWEDFQERLVQATEDEIPSRGLAAGQSDPDEGANSFGADPFYDQFSEEARPSNGSPKPPEHFSYPSYPSHSARRNHWDRRGCREAKEAIPWRNQANAGAGGPPPPHILAPREMARKRHRESEVGSCGDSCGYGGPGMGMGMRVQRRPPESFSMPVHCGTQVITHPCQPSDCRPWATHVSITPLEESLCEEVARLDSPDKLPETSSSLGGSRSPPTPEGNVLTEPVATP
jgi:hypothetical protein